MELAGKIAFITGSAKSIGKGYAEALLQKGVKVFLADINEAKGKATLAEFEARYGSENVRFMKMDVSKEDQFEEAFKAAIASFGQVDIMVNNAAILDESDWQNVVMCNLIGVIKGTKLAEQHMRKDQGGKGGRIINISSEAGLWDFCLVPVYCATKHAVRAFTMSQASQFDIEAKGIEYAVVCPIAVDTDMRRGFNENTIFFYELVKDEVHKNLLSVSEVVDSMMDLVQLKAMNGATLLIKADGGSYMKMEVADLGSNYVTSV